jgi:hypothetical protein
MGKIKLTEIKDAEDRLKAQVKIAVEAAPRLAQRSRSEMWKLCFVADTVVGSYVAGQTARLAENTDSDADTVGTWAGAAAFYLRLWHDLRSQGAGAAAEELVKIKRRMDFSFLFMMGRLQASHDLTALECFSYLQWVAENRISTRQMLGKIKEEHGEGKPPSNQDKLSRLFKSALAATNDMISVCDRMGDEFGIKVASGASMAFQAMQSKNGVRPQMLARAAAALIDAANDQQGNGKDRVALQHARAEIGKFRGVS